MKTRPHRKLRPELTLLILLASIVIGGAAIGSYLFYFRPVAEAVSEATGQVVPRLPAELAEPGAPPTSAQPAAPTPPPLTGNQPINILLLGSDTDAKFAGNYNTQIMIVASIVPAQKKVSMLSIPRDLWVQIPGHGVEKIGLAYGAGGVALTRHTIETVFGIPIHYYAWVGLDGFIKVIDTLGGVDVDVSHPIVDDAYPDDVNTNDVYAYRRLYIPAGLQHLDGTRALQYVRSRHGDLIGDFGRSQRQQQLLDALRSKSTGREIAAHLPELATDLKDSIRTDMSLQDLAKFAVFADQIRSEPVQQFTLLPPKYSNNAMAGDGQSVVVPDWRQIRPLVDTIFGLRTASTLSMAVPALGSPPTPTPAASAEAKPTGSATASVSVTPLASGTPHATESVRPANSATLTALETRAAANPSSSLRPIATPAATRAPIQSAVPTARPSVR